MSGNIDPVEFGKVLGMLSAIKDELTELKQRMTWRVDNLEERVETLEKVGASGNVFLKVLEKAIYGAMGALGVLALKAMGVV